MAEAAPELETVPCLVLAGGAGTRLRPAIGEAAKPLASVGGRPFLDYLLEWLGAQGVRRIVLGLGYRAEEFQRRYGDGRALGLAISYSLEREPQGTWGAIRLARQQLAGGSVFLACNGDSWLPVNLRDLLVHHVRRGALATLALAQVADTGRFGRVQVDGQARVTGFHEKDRGGPGWINGGVYALAPAAFGLAPPVAASLERDVLPHWLAGGGVHALPTPGTFLDIGTPEDYRRLVAGATRWKRELREARGGTAC